MAQDILLVIDMQNDFVTDALGTKEAQEIVPALTDKIKSFQGTVLYTLDTHFDNYMDTQEGHNLPVPHCIRGTKGWELVPDLAALQQKSKSKCYEKITFSSKELAMDLAKEHEINPISSITLTGVCTDICVVSNAMTIKAFLPEVPLYVEEALTAATSPEMKAKTLDVLKCCQVTVK